MPVEIRSLNIPDALYQRLRERAEQNHRTVEDELIEAAAVGIAEEDDIPPDLEKTLASLAALDDETLKQSARSHLPLEMWQEIEELHFKRQREGLMNVEKERLAWLMRQYERAMLIRGEATALLKERGYDVNTLLKQS
ncbi:MAG TPA: hypothetical protein VFU69_13450 [Ktedonobacterales bacterium]|nr:hypothetical protein [Ktedonobacterales bacterium]